MRIVGYLLPEVTEKCPYLAGRSATMEHCYVDALDEADFDQLLAAGYRHFGTYFYRPVCRACHACVPLRIPLSRYRFSSSARRTLARGDRFTVKLTSPHPTREAYALYLKHKERFESSPPTESYREFVHSFFHPFRFAYQLSVYDGQRLVAVSHVDITKHSISAVYCYYDDSYHRESLGSLCIYREIEIGIAQHIDHLYLGYFIAENRHMSYKMRFKPNQLLLEEGQWVDYLDQDGDLRNNIEKIEFLPKNRLRGEN